MANVIGEFVAKVDANTKGFQKGIDQSDKRMGKFATAFKKHGKAIAMGLVAIGAAAIATATIMLKKFAEAGDAIQKMALRTGFATEALSEYKHAAELSGTSLESLEKAVKRMQMQVLDASRGLKESIDNFKDLGITLEELEGQSPERQFEIITNALAGVEDQTLKAALAAKVFGRAGTELLPMLANGKEALQAMKDEAHKLGIVFDQVSADKAAALQDALTRLEAAQSGLAFTAGGELAPIITQMTKDVENVTVAFAQWYKGIQDYTVVSSKAIRAAQEHDAALWQVGIQFGNVANKAYDAQDAINGVTEAMMAGETAADRFNRVAAQIIASAEQARYREYVKGELGVLHPGTFAERGGTATPGTTPAVYRPAGPDAHTLEMQRLQDLESTGVDIGAANRRRIEEWQQIVESERLPEFQSGGIVPGYPGQRVPIMAHAGEVVSQAGAGGNTIIQNIAGSIWTQNELIDLAYKGFQKINRREKTTGLT